MKSLPDLGLIGMLLSFFGFVFWLAVPPSPPEFQDNQFSLQLVEKDGHKFAVLLSSHGCALTEIKP